MRLIHYMSILLSIMALVMAVPPSTKFKNEISGTGLNRDHCTASSDCQSPRACYDIVDAEQVLCPNKSESCFCFTEDPRCTSSNDCSTGEKCLPANSGQVCVSDTASGSGLNFDLCRKFSDCKFPRYCQQVSGSQGGSCTASSDKCICINPDLNCKTSSDCTNGESCVRGDNDVLVCVSKSTLGSRLNFEQCKTDEDCSFPRFCVDESRGKLDPCSEDSEKCFCRTKEVTCKQSSDCAKGETCIDGESGKFCASESILGPGLNFDECKKQADCRFPRECFDLTTSQLESCSANSKKCACRTREILCRASDDCTQGESCIEGDSSALICVSDATMGSGLNLDSCKVSSDCKFPRTCYQIVNDTKIICPEGEKKCFCQTANPACTSTVQCSSGESCIGNGGAKLECQSDRSRGSAAKGEITDSSSSGTGSKDDEFDSSNYSQGNKKNGSGRTKGCIAVSSLQNMKRHELLYDSHIIANVLCDASMNCATPGHMVVYTGKTMMMKTYCDVVTCTQKITQVNSPRYRPKLRVTSNTNGLQFTAFAARYESNAEEFLLNVLTRVGL